MFSLQTSEVHSTILGLIVLNFATVVIILRRRYIGALISLGYNTLLTQTSLIKEAYDDEDYEL